MGTLAHTLAICIPCLLLLHSIGVLAGPVDAIIVGGGLSGLSTAKQLAAASKTFIVLEARNRTGGRVHNAQLANGGYTEVGAEFIGPTQDEVITLAGELGLQLYDTYNIGSNILYGSNQKPQTYDSDGPLGAVPPLDPISILQLLSAQTDLDNMAKQIKVNAPWTSPNAAQWDKQTLGQWLDNRGLTSDARTLINVAVEEIFSAEPEELSLLYAVAYVASSGNSTTVGTFERLTSTGGGAQEQRVDGGTELLASRLATKLGSQNIILNSPVSKIELASGIYTVTTRSRRTYQGKHVVVAMSPPMAARIQYAPILPAARDQLCQHMPMGSIGKAIAVYATPFWRKAGLTGQVVSFSGTGRATFDNSPRNGTYGALMTFIEADEIRQLDSASEDVLKQKVVKDFVNYFGQNASNVQSWVFKRWDNEEFSRGGPVAVAGPGVLTQYGPALKQQVGNLHFAGTESSDYWVGYMDGAIRSGQRAANEVIGQQD